MRVPDSLCNAAIDVSQALGVVDPRNRSHGSDSLSDIALFEVLEGYDGNKVYRFRVPDEMRRLAAWDSKGNQISVASYELTAASDDGASSTRLESLVIPASIGTFWVGEEEGKRKRIGALETRAREIHRNCLMVNPGIDSLFPKWLKRNEDEPASVDMSKLELKPLFSIITPLYNTPIGFFNDMVDSVLAQTYENWQLVLVNASPDNDELRSAIEAQDDDRIVVVELEANKGISENTVAGIDVATGDYICFFDHDDVIEPNLLMEYAQAVNEDPSIDLLYCDEDSITFDGKERFNPSFKFDFNLELLLTHNYVCHMLAVSRRALDQVALYDSSVDGAQDFDLTLKVSRVAGGIKHVPKLLYHWRQHSGSTNGGSTAVKPYVIEASVKALSRYLKEDGIDAKIIPTDIPCVFEEEYPHSNSKDVSVVVVYETPLQLFECLDSLASADLEDVCQLVAVGPKVDMVADVFEPLGIAPDDLDHMHRPEDFLKEIAGIDITLIQVDNASFAVKANTGIRNSEGEFILLVSADVRLDAKSDAISKLRDHLVRDEVGLVSSKIMAADGLIYHAGLCVKEDGSIGYLNQGFIEGMGGGYHGCAECSCEYSAVDPCFIMFRKSDFDDLGGFGEGFTNRLSTGVDFSFKIRDIGKKVVVDPQSKVEIKPIGGSWELGASYIPASSREHDALWSKWPESYRKDVLSHPAIDLSSSYFRLKV